ncbi:MAG: hypothetical protein MJ105_06310 [Lachnospiraceae bacterium]|nr:hypothetical protein [Lachnospiraceae bacterium]
MGLTKKETEQAIRDAFTKVTPNVKKNIMEKAGKPSDMVVPMDLHNKRKHRVWVPYLLAAAALLFLCMNVMLDKTAGARAGRVVATVDIDVNPGVELTINAADRVLSARAVNQDAVPIVEAMDLTGATTKVAVNAIVGEMLRQGYLMDERTDAILVSVNAKDERTRTTMEADITKEIDTMLSACNVNATVITQALDTDPDLAAMAENLGISQGKASLIRRILKLSGNYTDMELAGFTIAELNELLTVLSENTVGEEDDEPGDTVSENSVSENTVSENSVSENSVSDNTVSENSVSENSVSENSVSENAIDEKDGNDASLEAEETPEEEQEVPEEEPSEEEDGEETAVPKSTKGEGTADESLGEDSSKM